MAKVLYGATMSLDGFIAGPDDDVAWLADFFGPDPVADELVANVGSVLSGARSYRGGDPNAGTDKEGAFGGAWHGPEFVLSRHPDPEPPAHVTFAGDLATAVKLAREAAGDKYVCVIGADVARQCLEAGECDEVLMFVAPILLGDGVRMFDHPGGTDIRLETTKVHQSPHATSMWFRVVK